MGNAKRAARLTTSIGVAVLAAMATIVPVSATDVPPRDKTALILCGATCPTARDADVATTMNQFIMPTQPLQPGQTITPVAVTAPGEAWPLTGLLRVVGRAFGDPMIFGPGGAAWPDVPWWKLTGLFDLTFDQSVEAGVVSLEAAMAKYGDDHLVIYGMSQGAVTANVVRERVVAQYPAGTTAPDIDFVLQGDVNVPNGGFFARFPGLYIPVIEWTFNGPQATDTPFDTVVINRQYDGFGDFPLYTLNVVSLLNAVLGMAYVHTSPADVSLPAEDPTSSPAYQGTHGKTSYYLFETQDLPLFAPLRTLGVPESLIDNVEPFFRVLVELGYDRTIPPWEPTPARLIPRVDPAEVIPDLVDAMHEGARNAATLVGLPPLPKAAAPDTFTAPTETETETESDQAPTNTPRSTIETTEKAEGQDDSTSKPARLRQLVRDSLNATDAADPPTTDEPSTTSEPAASPSTNSDTSDGDAGNSE